MWHFSYIFWRCDHFCCESLVLEVMPVQRSIALWCCNPPFLESKLRTVKLVKTTWCQTRCFDGLDSAMFWFTEPRIGASKTNGSLIWHNFQDQTSTTTVITPPKSMYSTGFIGICHMFGNFYEGRIAKFWYVRNVLNSGVWYTHRYTKGDYTVG